MDAVMDVIVSDGAGFGQCVNARRSLKLLQETKG
jgi:hypothetical protein